VEKSIQSTPLIQKSVLRKNNDIFTWVISDPLISVMLHNHSSPVLAPPLFYDLSCSQIFPLYPTNTKAFLYYFTLPNNPRIAGELRLRVAPSNDFSSFESGSDRLKPNGQPWSRPLYVLPKHSIPLYEKQSEDQLVPDDLDAVLSTFTQKYYHQTQPLYTLNDAFIINFGSIVCLSATTEQGTKVIPLAVLFFESRDGIHRLMSYTGAYTNHHLSILLD
jgi:hypothetical protein